MGRHTIMEPCSILPLTGGGGRAGDVDECRDQRQTLKRQTKEEKLQFSLKSQSKSYPVSTCVLYIHVLCRDQQSV